MTTQSNKRPSFSLASLIWMTFTAGALLVAFLSYRETQHLRAENQALRVKAGAVDVKDPGKIYARSIVALGNNEWHWRIYLPSKRRYRVHTVLGKIPMLGLVEGSSSTQLLDAGDNELQVAAKKGEKGFVEIVMSLAGSKSVYTIDEAHAPWIAGEACNFSAISETTKEFEPGKPIEFIRHRLNQRIPTGWQTDPNPCPGLLIWMQEVSEPEP